MPRARKARAAMIAEALSTAEREMLTTVFINKKTWTRSPSVGIPTIARLKQMGVLHETEDLLSGKTVHILTRQLGRWVIESLRGSCPQIREKNKQ